MLITGKLDVGIWELFVLSSQSLPYHHLIFLHVPSLIIIFPLSACFSRPHFFFLPIVLCTSGPWFYNPCSLTALWVENFGVLTTLKNLAWYKIHILPKSTELGIESLKSSLCWAVSSITCRINTISLASVSSAAKWGSHRRWSLRAF